MEARGEGERVPLREESTGAEEERIYTTERAGLQIQWLTVDGPMGVQHDEALKLARNYFYGGFCLLPWLWFANCFYFWPVLRHRHLDPPTRVYIVWSAICCLIFTTIVLGWCLTFSIGGKRVFGSSWEHLLVYDIADKYTMIFQSEG